MDLAMKLGKMVMVVVHLLTAIRRGILRIGEREVGERRNGVCERENKCTVP